MNRGLPVSLRMLRNQVWPEAMILAADEKERGLWG